MLALCKKKSGNLNTNVLTLEDEEKGDATAQY
jgi:hypothetical protein